MTNKAIKNDIKILGKLRITAFKEGKEVYNSGWFKNLVPINNNPSGVNLIIKRLLAGANDIEITHAKIGTSDTAAANTDTDLVAPVAGLEVIIADTTEVDDDEALFEFFIADGELADGDYKEFGMFCGTYLFSRAVFPTTYTKATGSDTKVEYTITITNV